MAPSRLLFTVAAVLLWTGCSDDDTTGPVVPGPTTFSGTLVEVEHETPLAGIEVTLFHPVARIALGRAVSDSAGGFAFADLVPGPCIPVVHSNLYRPVFLPRTQWLVEEGDQVHVTLRMRPVAGTSFDAGIMLHGRVIDDTTLEPIANARIEMNIFGDGELAEVDWSEYTGWSNELETTSDADGRYVIGPAPMLQDLDTGRFHTPNHRVIAQGYRGKTMPALEEPRDSEVMLPAARMVQGHDSGVISGRVVDRFGQPMPTVAVSAEWRRVDPIVARSFEPAGGLDLPDRLLIPGDVTWTDAEGHFEITGLPDGYCNVIAGPYPDDGHVGILVSGVEVQPDAGVGIELRAFPALSPTSPAEGEILDELPDRLEWEPVTDAALYILRLTSARDGMRILSSSVEPWFETSTEPEFFDGPDSYAWEVLARDAGSNGISRTDRPRVFHVGGPD